MILFNIEHKEEIGILSEKLNGLAQGFKFDDVLSALILTMCAGLNALPMDTREDCVHEIMREMCRILGLELEVKYEGDYDA